MRAGEQALAAMAGSSSSRSLPLRWMAEAFLRNASSFGVPHGNVRAFDRARSFASYKNKIIRVTLLLKFEQAGPLAKRFAPRLAELYRQNRLLLRRTSWCRCIEREKGRGYSQAWLLS